MLSFCRGEGACRAASAAPPDHEDLMEGETCTHEWGGETCTHELCVDNTLRVCGDGWRGRPLDGRGLYILPVLGVKCDLFTRIEMVCPQHAKNELVFALQCRNINGCGLILYEYSSLDFFLWLTLEHRWGAFM